MKLSLKSYGSEILFENPEQDVIRRINGLDKVTK
jgi:hypothetical protein